MKYTGITKETLFLMADNRFRDSKDFYEEHKEELKSGMTEQMRCIAGAVGEKLIDLDPMMNTIPTKMVSRIRRDTRYTKDKHLYRENMWIMFMRDKHKFTNYPCFWFEVTPGDYSMGIGFFGDEPGLMAEFREAIRNKTDEFITAVNDCESTGALLYGSSYKRMPDGCPEGLERYYAHKSFGFILHSGKMQDLESDKIIDIILSNFSHFSLMYKFMLEISDKYFSEGKE